MRQTKDVAETGERIRTRSDADQTRQATWVPPCDFHPGKNGDTVHDEMDRLQRGGVEYEALSGRQPALERVSALERVALGPQSRRFVPARDLMATGPEEWSQDRLLGKAVEPWSSVQEYEFYGLHVVRGMASSVFTSSSWLWLSVLALTWARKVRAVLMATPRVCAASSTLSPFIKRIANSASRVVKPNKLRRTAVGGTAVNSGSNMSRTTGCRSSKLCVTA